MNSNISLSCSVLMLCVVSLPPSLLATRCTNTARLNRCMSASLLAVILQESRNIPNLCPPPPWYQCSVITPQTAQPGWGLCRNTAGPSLPDSQPLCSTQARSAEICGAQGWGYFYSVYCILSPPPPQSRPAASTTTPLGPPSQCG